MEVVGLRFVSLWNSRQNDRRAASLALWTDWEMAVRLASASQRDAAADAPAPPAAATPSPDDTLPVAAPPAAPPPRP